MRLEVGLGVISKQAIVEAIKIDQEKLGET